MAVGRLVRPLARAASVRAVTVHSPVAYCSKHRRMSSARSSAHPSSPALVVEEPALPVGRWSLTELAPTLGMTTRTVVFPGRLELAILRH